MASCIEYVDYNPSIEPTYDSICPDVEQENKVEQEVIVEYYPGMSHMTIYGIAVLTVFKIMMEMNDPRLIIKIIYPKQSRLTARIFSNKIQKLVLIYSPTTVARATQGYYRTYW